MKKKVPIEDWCKCDKWKIMLAVTRNHDSMNFCMRCGGPLVKEIEVDDVETIEAGD